MKPLPPRSTFCVHHTNHAQVYSVTSCKATYVTCMCATRGETHIEIRISTESWPWRRKFSSRSCRDSNQRSFSHESSALPLRRCFSFQFLILVALMTVSGTRCSKQKTLSQMSQLAEWVPAAVLTLFLRWRGHATSVSNMKESVRAARDDWDTCQCCV